MVACRWIGTVAVVLATVGIWRVHYSEGYYQAHPKALQAEIARCEKTQAATPACNAAAAAENARLLNPKNNQVPSL